ncbi:hypothetical protein LRAMOSA01686 [Lichtheimia ramosa]|uniref:Mannosyltransferase n=1 Tax=Lichtheimia ramosa TaxID=688394 RepID=A0A077WM51_9FUNG|nr:hypothetical protein LRAMOSA01686 [Lichtheimia ramosa]
MDYAIYRICRSLDKDPKLPLALFATSHVALVYYVRPFSNSFESLILCLSILCFCTLLEDATSSTSSLVLGSLLVAGVFTRITFVLFGLPIGVAYLYNGFTSSQPKRFLSSLIPFIFGATLVAIVFVLADSLYYGTIQVMMDNVPLTDFVQVMDAITYPQKLLTIRASGFPVLTPLNNLMYNSDKSNLEQHGLHPLYLHFLVNFPMLFGPLVLGAVAAVTKANEQHVVYRTLAAIVVFGLGGLSFVPHQEARFLAPLLVPLILIFTWNRTKLSRTFWVIWMLFNLITGFIFGYLHQGGVVPSMMYLQQQTLGLRNCKLAANSELICGLKTADIDMAYTNEYNVTSNVLFYKTYMAPRHLIGYPKAWEVSRDRPHVRIEDFGSDWDRLGKELHSRSGVTLLNLHDEYEPHVNFAPSKDGTFFERTLIVAPSTAMLPRVEDARYLLVASFNPHVNFDDGDILLDAIKEGTFSRAMIGLNIYLLLSDG